MAQFRAAVGQKKEAIAELERASAENSDWVYAWGVDPKRDLLRKN